MQFAVDLRVRPDASAETQSLYRSAEIRAVWAAIKEGTLRSIHFHDGPGALLLMEAGGKADVEAYVRALPMVAAGVVDAEVLALKPFIDIEALFADALSKERPA